MSISICALWLQLTTIQHKDFEKIKDCFYSNLEIYLNTFELYDENRDKLTIKQQTIRNLIK